MVNWNIPWQLEAGIDGNHEDDFFDGDPDKEEDDGNGNIEEEECDNCCWRADCSGCCSCTEVVPDICDGNASVDIMGGIRDGGKDGAGCKIGCCNGGV